MPLPGLFLFCEIRFRWRADRIKPSADIHTGMGFPTEVASSLSAGRSGIPFEHGKFGIAAPDHEPVTGTAGDLTTDFASELLKRAHKLLPLSVPPFLWRTVG